jgi:hypothetical protein
MERNPSRRDPSVPEADALEQSRDWAGSDDEDLNGVGADVPEADALEQARPAHLDDEDH